MAGLELQKELGNICEKLSAKPLSLTGSTGQDCPKLQIAVTWNSSQHLMTQAME